MSNYKDFSSKKELLDLVRGKDDVTFKMIEEILEDEVEHEEDLQMIEQDMESGWDGDKIAGELVKVARDLVAYRSYAIMRDGRTKAGIEFKSGERINVVSYDRNYPYLMRLQTSDGRTMALPPSSAYRVLSGFPKPPSVSTLMKWSDDGVARAVDGARVEPDGISPSGAPSWLLVMGMI